jgi:hypothetical protein
MFGVNILSLVRRAFARRRFYVAYQRKDCEGLARALEFALKSPDKVIREEAAKWSAQLRYQSASTQEQDIHPKYTPTVHT